MSQNSVKGQSGGVNVMGSTFEVQGNVAGGDIISPSMAFHEPLAPVAAAIADAPPERRAEAQARLKELDDELQKGKNSDDGRVGRLVDGIVNLVPSAVSAIGAAFGSPLLSGIAGPVTKFVLEKIGRP